MPRQQPGGILTGQSSSESSSAVSTSRPGPRPSTPSVPGSGTTTPPGCTARLGISRPSSGSCAIVSKPSTPHNHVSGRRGEGQRLSGCSPLGCREIAGPTTQDGVTQNGVTASGQLQRRPDRGAADGAPLDLTLGPKSPVPAPVLSRGGGSNHGHRAEWQCGSASARAPTPGPAAFLGMVVAAPRGSAATQVRRRGPLSQKPGIPDPYRPAIRASTPRMATPAAVQRWWRTPS